MAYVDPNYKTKAEFKRAVAAGINHRPYTPGNMFPVGTLNGIVSIEGPHFPKPHTWYATATVVDGVVTKVK